MKTVVLLSGGLDSSANLALSRRLGFEPILALTANYGQRAAQAELRSARAIAEFYGVQHRELDLQWLGGIAERSALTNMDLGIPEPALDRLDDPLGAKNTAKAVWVANRNGVLINSAAAFAEALGAESVTVGFNREEAATFPDNSAAYLDVAGMALGFSTANQVRVSCHTLHLDKREIVQRLREECPDFPFDRVWSCYRDGESPCGRCESCRRYERALRNGR